MNSLANKALFFHESKSDYDNSSQMFATVHPVEHDENHNPYVVEGNLLDHDTIVDMLQLLLKMKPSSNLEFLPENVIAKSSNSIVWHVPSKVRTMYFKYASKTHKLRVPWPNLIFKVKDNKISIVSVAFKRKPKETDYIYFAPLMNVYHSHHVCTGNAKCPKSAELEALSDWESVIFDTYFTELHHDETLAVSIDEVSGKYIKSPFNEKENGHIKFWRSLDGENTFPRQALVQPLRKRTVADWILE